MSHAARAIDPAMTSSVASARSCTSAQPNRRWRHPRAWMACGESGHVRNRPSSYAIGARRPRPPGVGPARPGEAQLRPRRGVELVLEHGRRPLESPHQPNQVDFEPALGPVREPLDHRLTHRRRPGPGTNSLECTEHAGGGDRTGQERVLGHLDHLGSGQYRSEVEQCPSDRRHGNAVEFGHVDIVEHRGSVYPHALQIGPQRPVTVISGSPHRTSRRPHSRPAARCDATAGPLVARVAA